MFQGMMAQIDNLDAAGQAARAMEETTGVLRRLVDQAGEFLQTQGVAFAVKLLVAFLIYWIGKWVASIFTGILSRVMVRAKIDETLVRFACNILYAVLLIVVVIAALEQLGVKTNSVTAVLAAAGFAVGLALQGSLANFAAGIMLVVFKPFRVGDRVQAGGVIGKVEEIHIFNTVMRTSDNARIIVPNGAITGGNITNFTVMKTRRIDLLVGCGYGDDLRAVKSFLEQLLTADARVLRDPAPEVGIDSLADSSVNLVVQPWVKTEHYGEVRRDLLERIKLGFDEHGFTFPFPSRDVYVHPSAPAATLYDSKRAA